MKVCVVDEQGILEVFNTDTAELGNPQVMVEGILEPLIPSVVFLKNILDPFK